MVGPPPKSNDRGSWRAILRAARSLAFVVYAVLTAMGALMLPGLALALGVPFALIGGALVALLHKDAERLPPLPHPLVAGLCVGSLPVAVAGTTALGVPSGIVIGLGLVIGAAAGVEWLASAPARWPTRTAARADRVTDERSLRQVLRALPTDVLLAEWRSTHVSDDARGSEVVQELRMRELLIDEMQRRDPAGTARWLTESPDDPPDGYVRDRG
jgi:hypothetical protein